LGELELFAEEICAADQTDNEKSSMLMDIAEKATAINGRGGRA
jgi:hypothetical protein